MWEALITTEQLSNGLAALSSSTRATMLSEVEAAQRDTSVEYHRAQTRELQQKLWNEIQGLNILIESIKVVNKEYADVSG